MGDLQRPEGAGPHPVVLFVHGDGPNNRTSGVTYPPIMERMHNAGYATFAWDKPGTGESTGEIDRRRLGEQRAQIVLDAIATVKARDDIDTSRIGLWGISQAGYVIPRVLLATDDVAFYICVGCPGGPGVQQGAYLVSAQARCGGLPFEQALEMKDMLVEIEYAETYDEYVRLKQRLDAMPGIREASIFGYREGPRPEHEWHPPNLDGEYFWDPMMVIEQTTIPALVFFGGKDTQADPFQGARTWREALTRAGNPNFRVELVDGTDHNLIIAETGCLDERERRPRHGWTFYGGGYLDVLEEWLLGL